MENTRLSLLAYLQSREVASATEISRALHTTAANARHHLSVLVTEGVIRSVGVRKEGNRGRPLCLYALTESLSRHNLDNLADTLLTRFTEETPNEHYSQALMDLAKKLAAVPPQIPRSPTQRITEAVKRLNEMHYQARWEAHLQAPRLIFHHCPYAAILPSHPELCQVDVFMLEALLGTPISLVDRLVPSDLGLPQCVFKMNR